MSSKSSSKSSRGSAALFYFKWSSTTFDAYTKTVKANYLKILVAHCTRARLGDENASKSFDFSELGANPRIVKDDREDIRRRLKDAKTRVWTNEEAKPVTPVSLGELSALYRLKTLTKMCEQLGEVMIRMVKWLDNNTKVFSKFGGKAEIFDYVKRIFESVCAIGEIFRLTSVSWKSSKYAHLLSPTEKEYVRSEDERLEIDASAEKYCPQLLSQINYFRTLIYIIACSFEGLLETFFVSIHQDRCDIRQKEIKVIIQKLPPQYLFAKDTLEFSHRTENLLKHPPKNARSFPMKAIQENSEDSKKRESLKNLAHSKKSTKATSSKYYNGRNGGEKGSMERSQRSLKSDGTQPSSDKSKSKSKSKSKKSLIKKVLNNGNNSKQSDKE
ncbi:DUF4477 domain-containing protein [Caenorhabditis elegans]|uniref:DUF4477 domain-containing protein n=1 Tax=Caenorhabditis elegans TaxID=6239 RepID=Q20879_CAEEL|nr:DUF4477 domain-containing protein [Caenorhabditis elegans]CAA93498.2 DUF4477 domain-containing protein [Caenorhabditis elegans]|eukprot:NP_501656.2 Uncharacterized protein CELE_F56D5.2 [Caenorhabditis elegans]